MSLFDEINEDNKVVGDWLLHFHARKAEYEQQREEILGSSSQKITQIPIKSSTTSDSTLSKAEKLLKLVYMEQWITLIDEIERDLPWKRRIFLEIRREYRHAGGRKGWTTATQWKFAYEVAKRLQKDPTQTWVESRNTFTRWWNEIVTDTAHLAAKRNLFNTKEK